MRRLLLALLCAAACGATPAPAVAQLAREPAPPLRPQRAERAEVPPLSPVFLASAVLPGAAQLLIGDDRWIPYMAVEAWALISYVQQRQSARSLEQRYRDLAWQVARRVSVGERRDSVFEYYEAMAHYPSSGEWLPGGSPERQDSTFNAAIWRLAQSLYVPGGEAANPDAPGYQQALAYYLQRAIPPSHAWAWGASNLERRVYADLIRESDAAFRTATRYLGFIVANHITSAVDALVTTRLRQLAGTEVDLESVPQRDGESLRLELGLRVRF